MKIKIHLLLLLCAIPVAALWEGGRQTPGDTAVSGIALFMPQADTDFSDLDARDAQGNAIQNSSAKQELENLFRENIVTLTVFATPHYMAQTMDWLDSFSNLFNKLILMRVLIAFEAFQEAILPLTRRFVHNVHNLCVTFSVGIFAGCFLIAPFALQRSPRRLPLRC
jgi:NAD/NADP transhydrogenase alpha subunit